MNKRTTKANQQATQLCLNKLDLKAIHSQKINNNYLIHILHNDHVGEMVAYF
jgi:hypothetical protein